jgi:hypothetical protein
VKGPRFQGDRQPTLYFHTLRNAQIKFSLLFEKKNLIQRDIMCIVKIYIYLEPTAFAWNIFIYYYYYYDYYYIFSKIWWKFFACIKGAIFITQFCCQKAAREESETKIEVSKFLRNFEIRKLFSLKISQLPLF